MVVTPERYVVRIRILLGFHHLIYLKKQLGGAFVLELDYFDHLLC